MTDYLTTDDLAEQAGAPETVNVALLELMAQQLIAARETIDAALLTFDHALNRVQPQPARASLYEEEECIHPIEHRVSTKTIGSKYKNQWRCKSCGHDHKS